VKAAIAGGDLMTTVEMIAMTKYEFTLTLKGAPELTEEIADALFEAGCDDGTPGTCNRVFAIDFHREAASLESALQSAIANVRSAGYEVERVDIFADAIPHPVWPSARTSMPYDRLLLRPARQGPLRRDAEHRRHRRVRSGSWPDPRGAEQVAVLPGSAAGDI
jgi:hypothetical protein